MVCFVNIIFNTAQCVSTSNHTRMA